MEDYTELMMHTNNYRDSCRDLDGYLKEELTAKEYYMNKEKDVRIEHWEELQENNISNAKYESIIRKETLEEKIELEKAKTIRKIGENRRDSLREALYSYKKTTNIQ